MYDPEVAVSGSGVSTSGCDEKMGEDDGNRKMRRASMIWLGPFANLGKSPTRRGDAKPIHGERVVGEEKRERTTCSTTTMTVAGVVSDLSSARILT